uniref:Uncharacterized protein n=2 Tax=Ceratitis capitata TaxID=7213 RepID=W8BZD8_CERCA
MPDPIPTPAIYAHACTDTDAKFGQKSELGRLQRIKGPIYKVLGRGFYQDGCFISGHHFECLVNMEQTLIERKHEIHYVHENMDFLLQLVENVKAAEQIYQLDKKNGVYVCRRLLYQTIGIAEKQKYQWLTEQLYSIIAKYMLEPTTDNLLAKEQSTRFVFKYAKHLMQKGKPNDLQRATSILPIAIEAACGEGWKPDTIPETEMFRTLHAALSSLMANIYMCKAKEPGITRKYALKRTQKAIKAIAKVGIQEHKLVAFKAFLAKIEILMEADRYDRAFRELVLLKESVMKAEGPEFLQYQIDLLKDLGVTLYCLNQPITAIETLSHALQLCRKDNHWQAEADVLVEVGHAQRLIQGGEVRARLAFELAKIQYDHQGNYAKVLSSKYRIAALRSQLIQPDLMKVIRSQTYCDFYRLRHWKTLCERFWTEVNQVGYIKQNTLSNISKFSSQNLYKLYNLVLNTRASFVKIKESENETVQESSRSSSEEENDLERVVADNLYSNYDTPLTEAEEMEEELYESTNLSNSSAAEDVERSDATQRAKRLIIMQARKPSDGSRRSSPQGIWVVKDTDPLYCLLREF